MASELKAFDFDHEKATEALLYVASKLPRDNATFYIALKILYLADKVHLSRYGRFVSGDNYVAMKHGPVPSGAYDIVKYVRGDGICSNPHARNSFSIDRQTNQMSALREVDLGLFSESDVECLDEVIGEHGSKPFPQIRKVSHDAAWDNAGDNEFISLEDIVKTLPDDEVLADYLSDRYPG